MHRSALLHRAEPLIELDQSRTAGHIDKMSILGKYLIILIDQSQSVSTTEDLLVECVEPGAPRTFTEIKKLLMSIEKGEKEETERWEKGKEKNRKIKEILILSESVLIFSSGLAMCAQPIISLETKRKKGLCVCVFAFVCTLASCNICICFYEGRVHFLCGMCVFV